MTDEERIQQFMTSKPRGLEGTPVSQPTIPHDHLLGSTGEGRDKSEAANGGNALPIVPGRVGSDDGTGAGGSFPAVIVVSGVLYNCTVDGAIGAPV